MLLPMLLPSKVSVPYFGYNTVGPSIQAKAAADVATLERAFQRRGRAPGFHRQGWCYRSRLRPHLVDIMKRTRADFELLQRAEGVIDIYRAGVGRRDSSIQVLCADHLLQLSDLL